MYNSNVYVCCQRLLVTCACEPLPPAQVFTFDFFHKGYCTNMLQEFKCDAAAAVYSHMDDMFDTFCANVRRALWSSPSPCPALA